MMRRWIIPALIGLVIGFGAYQTTLLATPYVLMNAAMKKIGSRGPTNQFAFGDMATADNQPIVRPSPDLSYSTCVFDVSNGPVLIEVAPVPDHYWSVSIFDARTDVAAVRSDRDTAGRPARLQLYKWGPNIKVKQPIGYEQVAVHQDRGIALIRILVNKPDEFPAIDAIRQKSTCKQD